MSRRMCVGLPLVAMVLAFPAWACGPFFQASYLACNAPDVLKMPELSFFAEVSSQLGPLLPAPVAKTGSETEIPADPASIRQRVLDADVADLRAALQSVPDVEAVVSKYTEMRKAMNDWLDAMDQAREAARYAPYAPSAGRPDPAKEFSLAPYEELLAGIPPEFALYIRGAEAYHRKEFDKAQALFSAVLDLPAEQQRYRTLWATYMRGRTQMGTKAFAQAVADFERTRALVQEGCADPLNLAGESLGRQARAEGELGDGVSAIHHYVEYAKTGARMDVVCGSIKWACSKSDAAKMAKDPLAFGLMAAFYASGSQPPSKGKQWIELLEQTQLQTPVAGADLVAWAAYCEGDMAAAARWVERGDPALPRTKWVKAKLLLRDGKVDEGVALLREVSREPAGATEWTMKFESDGSGIYTDRNAMVASELGTTLLAKGDYAGALDALLHGGYWPDAVYLAECVLDVRQLETYVNEHKDDPVLTNPGIDYSTKAPAMECLRDLLARRLARGGEWDKAATYYATTHTVLDQDYRETGKRPPGEFAEKARSIAELLKKANDVQQSAKVRADAFFAAAKILRADGMELSGTELGPDWAIEGGAYEVCSYSAPRGNAEYAGKLSQDEAARVAASAPSPNKRFHYRYVAADLMWQCASLLPDNNAQTAEALYEGGWYLAKRDPEAADRFYKALVRRCPNLAVAREADELRWFPVRFDDRVLYHAPEKKIRKRDIAIAGAGALGLVFLAAGLILLKRVATQART